MKEIIDLINSNPVVFGLGVIGGLFVYLLITSIHSSIECAHYYFIKRKKAEKEQEK